MAFQYQKSDDVRKKYELSDDIFNQYLDKSKSPFSSAYTEKKNKAIADIDSIGDFKYDFADDPLYASIRDNYARQGKLAMQDTVGKASAATGGYGNSYAASAGAQAYNQYIAQTNEMIPELYQMAYNIYAGKKSDAYNKASLYDSLEATDYSRRQDDISRAYNDYTAAASRADSAYSRDYNEQSTAYQTAYQEEQDAKNFALSASSKAAKSYSALSQGQLDAFDSKINSVLEKKELGEMTDGDLANVWQYIMNVGDGASRDALVQYFENQFPGYKIDDENQIVKMFRKTSSKEPRHGGGGNNF